jgi:hypothetical protein
MNVDERAGERAGTPCTLSTAAHVRGWEFRVSLFHRRLVSHVLVSSLAFASLGTPAAARLRDAEPRVATVTTHLAATPAEVHKALLEALSTWKMRKESKEESIVKTEWQMRPKGDEMYRGRIVAEYQVDGYETVLSVKHEKQRQMRDLQTSIGGPQASWQDVNGDYEIAQAVVHSVEEALGQESEALQIGKKPQTSSKPIEVWDCIVSPDAATRINDLKARRRDLVTEVKAMDQEILKGVYDGKIDQMHDDVERIKQRKTMMEQQVTDIDKEILALVIAD